MSAISIRSIFVQHAPTKKGSKQKFRLTEKAIVNEHKKLFPHMSDYDETRDTIDELRDDIYNSDAKLVKFMTKKDEKTTIDEKEECIYNSETYFYKNVPVKFVGWDSVKPDYVNYLVRVCVYLPWRFVEVLTNPETLVLTPAEDTLLLNMGNLHITIRQKSKNMLQDLLEQTAKPQKDMQHWYKIYAMYIYGMTGKQSENETRLELLSALSFFRGSGCCKCMNDAETAFWDGKLTNKALTTRLCIMEGVSADSRGSRLEIINYKGIPVFLFPCIYPSLPDTGNLQTVNVWRLAEKYGLPGYGSNFSNLRKISFENTLAIAVMNCVDAEFAVLIKSLPIKAVLEANYTFSSAVPFLDSHGFNFVERYIQNMQFILSPPIFERIRVAVRKLGPYACNPKACAKAQPLRDVGFSYCEGMLALLCARGLVPNIPGK